MDIEGMSNSQLINCARELRNRGYAVVIFTSEEVGEADPSDLEDIMVERGWCYIDSIPRGEDDE